MKKYIFTFSLFFLCALSIAQTYERKVFVSPQTGDTLKYRLLTPQSEKKQKKYPLVLFLHGAGERGSDNEAQLKHCTGAFLNPVNRDKFPAYVLVPQCPKGVWWAFRPGDQAQETFPASYEISPLLSDVKALLDCYIARPDIDPSRVYIVGISMGGMATFDMVCRFPEVFAAAIPICGGVNPVRLSAAKNVKMRIYHGDSDTIVPVKYSREAYQALKKCGGKVEYIEFVGCDHDSWNPAFNTPGFMDWIFSQKK
ncbi:prolyl oligopeptidase family serine peptidase [Coprobacter tertius]|uniref:Prolyl oligopeptidase family serine peptidase n=1 Tax=Coprobacter tertius TaxID=2944915 RepID=A0ABT1MHD4_9BACT|nr:prolyl oligopeptidase family serine peptidase [Coprobacter tertius]MCP9612045.1 prolyl oligopeptidase family serine peptidase [Coprobacter tertius]